MIRQVPGHQAAADGAVRPSASPLALLHGLLRKTQRDDGGWSARPGGPSDTESTSLSLLALSFGDDGRLADPAGRAKEWLRTRQRPDGSWPHSDQVPLSHWMTSLAVLALGRSQEDGPRVESGVRWLLQQEGRGHSWLTRLMFRFFPERKPVELDWDLTGWPWLPDTFSWVEPTSYALIALKSLRPGLSRRARARIEEAERMIFDRTCEEGGWNYGNSLVLGEQLWPYPDTTAVGLIALQDVPRNERIDRSLAALRRMLAENDSVLVQSLGVLALQLYGEDVSQRRAYLVDRLQATASPPVHTRAAAFAALALEEDSKPLEVPRDA